MKYILTLACAVLTACGQTTNTNETGIFIPSTNWSGPLYTLDATNYHIKVWSEYFPIEFTENFTNCLTLNVTTNIVTQWLPIEREEGQRAARVKQIGILVTNQLLTVIAYDKTNEVILKMLGREEWPSQKRVVVVPNSQIVPRLSK